MSNKSSLPAIAGIAAVAVAAAVGLPWAASASASTKSPVSGYVMAWRQTGASTLLVAYRAKNDTTSAQKNAVCQVKARPSVKIPKPYYYTLKPAQTFTLATASSKFTYIGAFSLPALPSHSHISRVWVSCT
jgi:hypothetical protein